MQALKTLLGLAGLCTALEVMTWQPYYRFDSGLEAYQKHQKHISRLGLQYWSLDTNGKMYLTTADSNIARFKAIADSNHAKTLLCLFNVNLQQPSKSWDWALAKKAFIDQRSTLIADLLSTVDQYHLHGVDLDIEGSSAATSDTAGKAAYLSFAKELSDSLHARGALLTADTYASGWGGPSQTWWPQMAPIFDGIQVMGYSETSACPSLASYKCYSGQAFTANKAGLSRKQFLLGLPSEKDDAQWGSPGVVFSLWDNLRDTKRLLSSVAIWDLPGLGGSNWSADSTMALLDSIYNLKDSGQAVQVPVLQFKHTRVLSSATELHLQGSGPMQLEIVDVQGQVRVSSLGRSVVYWGHLPAGNYILRMKDGFGWEQIPLLKS